MHLVRLFGVSAVSLFVGLAWYIAPLEPSILELQFAFTPDAFTNFVDLWTEAHLERYRTHLLADFVLLVSYGLFGYVLATRTPRFDALTRWQHRFATWALPIAATFDAAENVLHLWLTEVPQLAVRLPYLLAAASASAKWILLVAFVLLFARVLVRPRHTEG